MNALYGVRLVGGEMVGFSEDGRDLPGGEPLRELIERAVPPDAHVLVAGPHRTGLMDWLIERFARVTCLLRSLADAEELGRRHADDRGLTILCGALGKLPDSGPYDAVVAAGGLARLGTPDSSPLTWAESMHRLAGLLADDGTFVLGLENELGVHRLVTPSLVEAEDDSTVPAGPVHLVTALAEAGLAVAGCYAAYPDPAGPAFLLAAELLGTRLAAYEIPATLVTAALADGFAGRHVLTDPRRLIARALTRGLAGPLAPGWVTVARRGPATGDLPVGLGGHDGVTWELRRDGDQWVRVGVRPLEPLGIGRVWREPARLAGPIPYGLSLDETLLAACAGGDVSALRRTLRSYARWLAEEAVGGELPGNLVFATTTNVVVDGDRFALVDPSWELARPMPFRLALARLLRDFARRLLVEGHPHPWPSTLDLDGIAVTLLAMTGHPADRALLDEAVLLEAEIVAAREGLPGADEARLVAELRHGAPRRPLSHRDALLATRRLADELRQAHARAEWLDTKLEQTEKAARERQERLTEDLKQQKAQLKALRRSRSYRLARFLARFLRRGAR